MAERLESQVSSVQSLYELSLSAVVDNIVIFKKNVYCLPQHTLFDLCYELYKRKRLCLLQKQFRNMETFAKMLNITNRRIHLLQMFQALIKHGTQIKLDLILSFNICCLDIRENPAEQEKVIDLGLRLGEFLCDSGLSFESEEILLVCKELCLFENNTPQEWCRTLRCCHMLLHVQTIFYSLMGANETYNLILEILEKLEKEGHDHNMHAALYTEFSLYHSVKSEYNEAYKWSMKALKSLKPTLPASTVIDVLRQAERARVNKCKIQKGGMLIKQAVCLAREVYGRDHPKYSDVLSDYGFYLVNTDNISNSVTVYEAVLNIRSAIFGKTNLLVALVHVDLAYALYVHLYTSRVFTEARDHAEMASGIMKEVLPANHVMQSFSYRVKALILEEVALLDLAADRSLLNTSLRLQLSAFELVRSTFGERNVQTAKHYGNLGRLHQSMGNYQTSEVMHLQAISIKENLLGPEHSEVGLSLGHLASLYTFQMHRYRDAEELYHRSMAISLKVYGEAYSGLEYDYRGLLHTYIKLEEYEKCSEYRVILDRWGELRKRQIETKDPPFNIEQRPQPIEDLIKGFFYM